ncbi:MAG TPA: hypothetical protein VF960_02070 [Chloroflexota bacterium]
MRSSVARMLYDSLRRGDPLDAEWFWEAGVVSAKEGTPLDIVLWDAVREIVEQYETELPLPTESKVLQPQSLRAT